MSGLRNDPLFGGLTRPATMLGLPIEALVGIFMLSVVTFLISGIVDDDVFYKIFALGMGAVFYGLARLLCARDARAFRYMALQLQTKGMHRTRARWGCGSYSPVKFRRH